MMFLKSCASLTVVSALMLLPVRLGTLYKIIGNGDTAAIAL